MLENALFVKPTHSAHGTCRRNKFKHSIPIIIGVGVLFFSVSLKLESLLNSGFAPMTALVAVAELAISFAVVGFWSGKSSLCYVILSSLFLVFLVYQVFNYNRPCFCFGKKEIGSIYLMSCDLLLSLSSGIAFFTCSTKKNSRSRAGGVGFASAAFAIMSILILGIGWNANNARVSQIVSPCDWTGGRLPFVADANNHRILVESKGEVLVLKKSCDVCTEWLNENYVNQEFPMDHMVVFKTDASNGLPLMVKLKVLTVFEKSLATPTRLTIEDGRVMDCQYGIGDF